jgi:hypothetical protein
MFAIRLLSANSELMNCLGNISDRTALSLSVAAQLLPISHQTFNSMNSDPFASPELDVMSSEELPWITD